jgi:hypothetical protein
MAFDNEKIVPNLKGVPRIFQRDTTPRTGQPRQLTAAEQERAYRYARDQRISVASAIEQLFGEG